MFLPKGPQITHTVNTNTPVQVDSVQRGSSDDANFPFRIFGATLQKDAYSVDKFDHSQRTKLPSSPENMWMWK